MQTVLDKRTEGIVDEADKAAWWLEYNKALATFDSIHSLSVKASSSESDSSENFQLYLFIVEYPEKAKMIFEGGYGVYICLISMLQNGVDSFIPNMIRSVSRRFITYIVPGWYIQFLIVEGFLNPYVHICNPN